MLAPSNFTKLMTHLDVPANGISYRATSGYLRTYPTRRLFCGLDDRGQPFVHLPVKVEVSLLLAKQQIADFRTEYADEITIYLRKGRMGHSLEIGNCPPAMLKAQFTGPRSTDLSHLGALLRNGAVHLIVERKPELWIWLRLDYPRSLLDTTKDDTIDPSDPSIW